MTESEVAKIGPFLRQRTSEFKNQSYPVIKTHPESNCAMTLFTSLGPSADCMGLTQVVKYQGRTNNARAAAFSVSQRGFSLGWGLQGKVARTPHQSKGSGGTVCPE